MAATTTVPAITTTLPTTTTGAVQPIVFTFTNLDFNTQDFKKLEAIIRAALASFGIAGANSMVLKYTPGSIVVAM